MSVDFLNFFSKLYCSVSSKNHLKKISVEGSHPHKEGYESTNVFDGNFQSNYSSAVGFLLGSGV